MSHNYVKLRSELLKDRKESMPKRLCVTSWDEKEFELLLFELTVGPRWNFPFSFHINTSVELKSLKSLSIVIIIWL